MPKVEPPEINIEEEAPEAVVDPSQKVLTKRQQIIERHREKAETLKSAQKLLANQYLQIRGSDALVDLQTKMQGYQDYHLKLAKDGVAYEPTGQSDSNGESIMRTVRLTPEERTGHLDKASGIQEIIDYLDRRLALPTKSDV